MTPQLSSGGTIAVGDGLGLDAYLYLPPPRTAPSPGIAPLLIIAEPLEFAPGQAALVRAILEVLVAGLAAAEPNADPSLAVCRLLESANAQLCADNAARASRPLYLGLSCLVGVGRELAIVQAAPTQVIVRHEGVIEEFPSLAGWTSGDVPEDASLIPCTPLGLRRDFEPALSFAPAGPGTLALGLSSTLALALNRQSGQLLLRSRPEELAGRLERWLRAEDLHWGHAALAWVESPRRALSRPRHPAVTIGPGNRGGPLDSGTRNGQTEEAVASRPHNVVGDGHELTSRPGVVVGARTAGQPASPFATRSSGIQSREDRVVTRSSTNADAQQLVIRAGNERFSFSNSQPYAKQPGAPGTHQLATRPGTVGRGLVEILAALLVGLTAAVVSVWRISQSTTNRPIHGPRDDGTLGLPHLQRWSDGPSPKARRFEGARRVTPRFEFSRLALLAIVLAVLAVGGFFAYNRYQNRQGVGGAELESKLADVITLHAQANNAGDPALAYDLLLDAQTRVTELAGAFADGESDPRVLEQQQAIAAELAQLTKLTQLDAAQTIGGVPAAPEGVNAQLFSGGGRIYLLSDALYQVDVTGQSLVRLLAPGDLVGDQPVGTLLAATWRDDGPYVVDGAAGYIYDLTRGLWNRETLGAVPEGGAPQVSAIAIFDYNLYVLEANMGRILKYAGGDYEAAPEDWSGDLATEDLQHATDLVVDGNIYVGLTDGRILHLFLSTLKATFTPQALPPVDAAAALAASPDVSAFYIVNETDGRILKLDASGQLLQQYQPGPELPSFEGITDLVVDEGTGIAYVLVGDAIYATRLTTTATPPADAPESTPEGQ